MNVFVAVLLRWLWGNLKVQYASKLLAGREMGSPASPWCHAQDLPQGVKRTF